MNLMMYGSPNASADLFHAVPEGIIDPIFYAEVEGERAAVVSVLDADRVRAKGIEVIDPVELGADELLDAGLSRYQLDVEIALRACPRPRVARATVPPWFPLGLADRLRGGGIKLDVDAEPFVALRRQKEGMELEVCAGPKRPPRWR